MGNKFGQSVKASLMEEELLVTEIDESLMTKFKAEGEKDKNIKKLEGWQIELCNTTEDDYQKHICIIHKDSSSACILLYSKFCINLLNILEAEPEWQKMLEKNHFDAMKTCQPMKRSCNGSTTALVDDALGKFV